MTDQNERKGDVKVAAKGKFIKMCLGITMAAAMLSMTACQKKTSDKRTIEIVSYKQEAVKYFDALEKKFNEEHDDIELKISSPNDAMTVLKTRFIREDYPDIIAIGGEYNFSSFLDAEILQDVSDYKGISDIKESYITMDENLEFVPTDGTYGLPYMANGAGILYNKDLFQERGWTVPQTWDEMISLCKQIQSEGVLPFYMGYKDTWTTMSPWNAAASTLTDADVCRKVNRGETNFATEYKEVAEQMKTLLAYGPADPVAYSYNDACTSFAKGESAMYMIGSYAVPQIRSVNPDINLGMFTYPASRKAEDNILTSGVDLQFCLTTGCKDKEAAYEVLDFLYQDENIQAYINDQIAIPCKKGEFKLPELFEGVSKQIEEDKMADFQDHFYPSEMAVDALVQTYLLEGDTEKFLKDFDKSWIRYNEDLIEKVNKYQKEH